MHITSVGIDLGKTTFHLVALDEHGKAVVRKKFSRKQLLAYTANLQASLIGIEACSGAHFIGAHTARARSRRAAHPGAVRQALPQVEQERLPRCRSYRRSGGAREHASCPIKTDEQLDLQAMHRVRDRLV
jgi:transposase